jgi:hypothetical protein
MRSAARIVRMRPVDLFVEFGVVNGKTAERAERAGRGMQVIGNVARAGRSGSTGNVVLAWVDAGLAVLDAVASYATYRQAVEVTRQLEAEADALRVRLSEIRKQCAALTGQASHEQKQRVRHIQSTQADQMDRFRIERAHYTECKEDVRRLGDQLVLLRQASAPSCPQLARLEREFHHLVAAQVAAAVVLIDS